MHACFCCAKRPMGRDDNKCTLPPDSQNNTAQHRPPLGPAPRSTAPPPASEMLAAHHARRTAAQNIYRRRRQSRNPPHATRTGRRHNGSGWAGTEFSTYPIGMKSEEACASERQWATACAIGRALRELPPADTSHDAQKLSHVHECTSQQLDRRKHMK